MVELVTVTVPAGFVANSIVSEAQVLAIGFATVKTGKVLNRPIVPVGSIARLRAADDDPSLRRAWIDGQVAPMFYFDEDDVSLEVGGIFNGLVPGAYICGGFNINPGEPGGDPASGAMTEPGTVQIHNVAEALPGQARYSPLWMVVVYDNAVFDAVTNLETSEAQTAIAFPEGHRNCPIVDDGTLAAGARP